MDRFAKPNYLADLTELTGKLSVFSSQMVAGQPNMADLELRGRAEGTTSLEIVGKLNPLVQPPALDIKGRVRDLELPPLSPYAVKYAGHGIERGKLSVDVGNLIGKALTAPFSLLASAFDGGGDELSQLAFANGSAMLLPSATAGLDKIAKALADRPMLKMTVAGTANLAIERDAYQSRRLQELMQAEQRRASVMRGAAAPATAAGASTTRAIEPARAASAPGAAASTGCAHA